MAALRRLRAARRRLLADDTRSQKASLNALAAMLDYGARIIVGLLLNPLLVSRLGDVVYGVYQSLLRLIVYATPAGGRPSQALKWTIARHQHSEAFDEKRMQVGSALAVWVLFLPVLTIAGGVLAWIAPVILGLPPELHTTVRIAAGLLVADLILTNLLTIPQSVVQGENLGYKRMGLSVVVVLGGGALTAVMVVLGAGIIGVTASVVATTIATGLLFLWVARRNVPWFGATRAPFRAVTAFLRLSGWFLLWNLVMQLLRASDVVVLGVVGSPELVTVYTLAKYVPEAIFGVVAIVVSAIMPGLGGIIGAGDLERAAAVRSESMIVTWLLATSAGGAFLVCQESFLTVWVGAEYYPGAVANLLVILMILQFAFIRTDSSIIDLSLELRGKVLLGFLAALLAIAVSAVLVASWDSGIEALAVGFLAGRAVLSVAYPWQVGGFLGISATSQLWGLLRPLAVTALVFGAALALAPLVDLRSWPALVVAGPACAALAGAVAFVLGLTNAQRRRARRRVRQVLGRA